MTRVSLEHTGSGGNRRYMWCRKDEEYIADFTLVSRRALTEEEYKLFRYHFLLGADWKLCCRKMKIDRGAFFHSVYRIQQTLGQVFRELEPYALYPLDEYFGSNRILGPVQPTPLPPAEFKTGLRANLVPIRATPVSAQYPLLKAA